MGVVWLDIHSRLFFSEGNALMSDEVKSAICVSDTMALDYFIRSYELLKKEAQAGNGESMHLIAMYYATGLPPVGRDKDQVKMWTDKAASAGYVVLDDLLAIYGDKKSAFYDPVKAHDLYKLL